MVPAESQTGQPLEILVVDDNRDSADTLYVLLQMWGHRVRVAYGGRDALKAIADSPPDCVLLDLNMPDIDGYTVARTLRQQLPPEKTKLVALTAYSDECHVNRIWEVGFNCYLNKLDELSDIERVLQCFSERVEHN